MAGLTGQTLRGALEALGKPSDKQSVANLRKRLIYHGYLVKGQKPYRVDLAAIEALVPDLFDELQRREREKLVRSQVADLVRTFTNKLQDLTERVARLEATKKD